MSDTEIMAAIGWDAQFEEEQPTMKSKKSFIQKLTERHEALKLHIRSPKVDDLDTEDQRAPSRGSSSSSAQKDFFKLPPTVWPTKPAPPIAMRYDDIADSALPSPVFVNSPVTTPTESSPTLPDQKTFARIRRQDRRESSVMEFGATHRLYTSHSISSFGSPRTSIRFEPPKPRSRSLPSEMSEEQMDAWLDAPEDAELHRLRMRAESEIKQTRRKPVPVVFRRENPFVPLPTSAHPTVAAGLSLPSLPIEVVLEIAKRLDGESVKACRLTCKKMRGMMPAPREVVVSNKT
jgi:hypothetical protein